MNKHIFYLAAGNSRRFGSNKLLYPYKGKQLYRYGLDMLKRLIEKRKDCALTVVSQYEEILSFAEKQGIRAVYSSGSVKGMSYTIRAGLTFAGQIPEEDFVVFVVADQPHLSEETMTRLLDCAAADVETASVSWEGRPGNPAMFSARLIPELLALSGDEGGRKIMNQHSCIFVSAKQGQELWDIDRKKE